MTRHGTLLMLLATISCGGCCFHGMSNDELAKMRPSRPEALDRLNMLAGDWETTGEIRMAFANEVIRTHGHNYADWDVDRHLLVDHSEMDMGPMGLMSGLTVWGYDESKGRYRMSWFDSFGEASTATARFHEMDRTWHMKMKGRMHGFTICGTGTIRHVDENTLEWTWIERVWGIYEVANMKGTSQRSIRYDGLNP
ncbi:MAG: DUF1579 family protein [Planctomycetes bacterium]|nr:DUF1579 family protein [Planctomycetota bacterium]MBI3836209.1 DUF1579 family protein [Planctomycetota bacterium]